jgi:hypothetical protein
MRPNAVEMHPQRLAIEAELVAGASVRAIAAKYSIPKSAVQRHRDKLPGFVRLAVEAARAKREPAPTMEAEEAKRDSLACPLRDSIEKLQEEADNSGTTGDIVPSNYAAAVQEIAAQSGQQSGQSILEQVTAYNAAVLEIFTRCKEERPALALAAVREARGLLELQGKLLGDLRSETDVKIAILFPEGMRNANARS